MGITERMHQVRGHLLAWGLQRAQGVCVRLARGYQWRFTEQGESQQEMARTVLASVYTQGVLRGMSGDASCAVSEIRAAIQDSDVRLKWSLWLSFLAQASYVYGTLLLAAHEADSLMADDVSAIF